MRSQSQMNLDQCLAIAKSAATQAGLEIARLRSEKLLTHSFKSSRDLVTSADIAADKIINETILKAFPQHQIFSEESSPEFLEKGSWKGALWIIDPIDGTINYAQGLPQVGISIALAIDGKVHLGLVHAPFQNETFFALRDRGAFCNDTPIKCRAQTDLTQALIATGFPYDRNNLSPLLRRIETVLTHCQDLRRLGAASLDTCWVACGRLDGYYETVMPWDIAAGGIIAREAGALTGNMSTREEAAEIPADLDGKDFLVASPAIFEKLKQLLR